MIEASLNFLFCVGELVEYLLGSFTVGVWMLFFNRSWENQGSMRDGKVDRIGRGFGLADNVMGKCTNGQQHRGGVGIPSVCPVTGQSSTLSQSHGLSWWLLPPTAGLRRGCVLPKRHDLDGDVVEENAGWFQSRQHMILLCRSFELIKDSDATRILSWALISHYVGETEDPRFVCLFVCLTSSFLCLGGIICLWKAEFC